MPLGDQVPQDVVGSLITLCNSLKLLDTILQCRLLLQELLILLDLGCPLLVQVHVARERTVVLLSPLHPSLQHAISFTSLLYMESKKIENGVGQMRIQRYLRLT